MGKIIEVEGFKSFRGKMRVDFPIFKESDIIAGDWLYKPNEECWYCGGNSYPAEFCEIVEVE